MKATGQSRIRIVFIVVCDGSFTYSYSPTYGSLTGMGAPFGSFTYSYDRLRRLTGTCI